MSSLQDPTLYTHIYYCIVRGWSFWSSAQPGRVRANEQKLGQSRCMCPLGKSVFVAVSETCKQFQFNILTPMNSQEHQHRTPKNDLKRSLS